ncbi:MAG: hypothetical protein U0R24_04880 [Solirubrobacterales bacterium]
MRKQFGGHDEKPAAEGASRMVHTTTTVAPSPAGGLIAPEERPEDHVIVLFGARVTSPHAAVARLLPPRQGGAAP